MLMSTAKRCFSSPVVPVVRAGLGVVRVHAHHRTRCAEATVSGRRRRGGRRDDLGWSGTDSYGSSRSHASALPACLSCLTTPSR